MKIKDSPYLSKREDWQPFPSRLAELNRETVDFIGEKFRRLDEAIAKRRERFDELTKRYEEEPET